MSPAVIEFSGKRLLALGLIAAVCALPTAGFAVMTLGIQPAINWTLTLISFALTLLMGGYAAASFYALWRASPIAYRFDADGVYLGERQSPTVRWADVKGATLARGKRRSAVVLVLNEGAIVDAEGLLPVWLTTFLGRPTDKDFALTNMDTTWQLQPFLDLIQHHLDTYGSISLQKGDTTS